MGLGPYYRGGIDLTTLAARGTVYPPGAWGRLMNGGWWLVCGDERVDVLLRDLDVVEHWTRRAELGEFEADALLGYVAGVGSLESHNGIRQSGPGIWVIPGPMFVTGVTVPTGATSW